MYKIRLFSFLRGLALPFAGAALILFATRWGIGASPDSVIYITGARYLAAGLGFNLPGETIDQLIPITRFGPLYSSLLAAIASLGADPLTVARSVSAGLFGGLILLAGVILHYALRKHNRAAVLGSLLGSLFVLIAPPFQEIYLMAWSEGLFLFLGLLGCWFLGLYLDQPQIRWLVLGALGAGSALLTRYAGVAFLGTGLLGLVFFSGQTKMRRLLDAFVFLLLGALPLGAWMIRNLTIAGTSTARQFVYHPIGRAHLSEALTTFSSWSLIPDTASSLIKAIPAGLWLLLISYLVLRRWQSIRQPENRDLTAPPAIPGVIVILMVFIPVYGSFLTFSLSFFDANTPLDNRILSPVLLALILIAIYWGRDIFLPGWHKRPTAILVLLAAVVLSTGYAYRSAAALRSAFFNGLGFNSLSWQRSETIRELRTLQPDIGIYSNAPEAILLHTGRPASRFPKPFEDTNQRPNPSYAQDYQRMQESITNGDAVLVYFDGLRAASSPSEDELIVQLGLSAGTATSDGTIYEASSALP